MRFTFHFIIILLFTVSVSAQTKFDQQVNDSDYSSSSDALNLNLEGLYRPYKANTPITSLTTHFQNPRTFKGVGTGNQGTLILKDIREDDQTVWLELFPSSKVRNLKGRNAQVYTLLDELKDYYHYNNAVEDLKIISQSSDDQGNEHFRLKQLHQGVEVYGGELLMHTHNGIIDIINGRTIEVNKLNINPSLTAPDAELIASTAAKLESIREDMLQYVGGKQVNSTLIIYPSVEKTVRLAYKIDLYPDLSERWQYIVDAHTGEIIHSHLNSCKLHHHAHDYSGITLDDNGPETANERDLAGNNVNVDVYEEGGIFYLLNVGEQMFNASLSRLPNEPVGGILTLNAKNTSPQTDDFSVDHIATNNNIWDAPVAVTAHANATKSYRYFEDNFGRTSYDNKGSTINSFINVADEDGSGMDNAFWNGFALFYGNGNQAFTTPLAAAEDVAAHELSHGVIQHTANLNYQGESGALNESFADIFGAMIDRDNWTIGESVVNPNVFRSGALRSLSDPHNGGNSLSDPGFQPKRVSEQFRGSEDNGGVHINSGITNFAFFLFASDASVGKERAELIYYKALRDYLTASSDFVSLRRAVGQSIIDLFGNDQAILAAYNSAFDNVGIGSSTDTAPEVPEITEFDFNPGDDFVIWYKEATSEIMLRTIKGEQDISLSNLGLSNIPSISDDGRTLLFVGVDKNMYAILFDWEADTFEEILVNDTREWRNVAISKDGTKIAAVSGNLSMNEFDNQILIVDLESSTQRWYPLTNPTTAEGVSTGDVKFADALQWDHSGEFVMYDAQNEIESFFNDPIEYWDIGFLKAWNQESNNYGDGEIFKLFPSLPENVSVGNPTFTKASPDIIAMDLIDGREGDNEYSIIGVNLETSDQGLLFENNTVGYPRYSTRDDLVLFDASQSGGTIVGVIETRTDRITSPGEGFLFIDDARWGVWFSNGERDLTTAVADIITDERVQLYPNPTSDFVSIELNGIQCKPCDIKMYDTQGRTVLDGSFSAGENIDVSSLTGGVYTLLLRSEEGLHAQRIVKE